MEGERWDGEVKVGAGLGLMRDFDGGRDEANVVVDRHSATPDGAERE